MILSPVLRISAISAPDRGFALGGRALGDDMAEEGPDGVDGRRRRCGGFRVDGVGALVLAAVESFYLAATFTQARPAGVFLHRAVLDCGQEPVDSSGLGLDLCLDGVGSARRPAWRSLSRSASRT
jgi:hypothetical protein